MNINERVKYFYSEYLKIRPIDFAKEIGMSKTVVSNLDNAANAPSFRFIEAIKKAYPEIDLNWLIIGDGDMLLGAKEGEVHSVAVPKINQVAIAKGNNGSVLQNAPQNNSEEAWREAVAALKENAEILRAENARLRLLLEQQKI